jgi:hypothetical protein
MTRLVTMLALTLALAATAAASAGATAGPAMLGSASPLGIASNTAADAGSEGTNLGPGAMTVSGLPGATCSSVQFRITSVTTTTATLDPAFQNCAVFIGGMEVEPVPITTPCDWTVTVQTGGFSNATGHTVAATLRTNCTTALTFDTGCTVDVLAQTRTGVTLQNVDTVGANSTSATPWGSKVSLNISTLTYARTGTTGLFCSTMPPAGTVSLVSSFYAKNVWGRL